MHRLTAYATESPFNREGARARVQVLQLPTVTTDVQAPPKVMFQRAQADALAVRMEQYQEHEAYQREQRARHRRRQARREAREKVCLHREGRDRGEGTD